MDNILIVLNHQTNIPPFMLTALRYAKHKYDKVYYINTKYPHFADVFLEDNNIVFLQPTNKGRIIAKLKAFFRMFYKSTVKNIMRCISDKGLNFGYIKTFGVGLAADACIRPIADKIIKKHSEDKITVLSTWLAFCAYSAACLKKEHKHIKAVSMAHSYEILASRNPLIPYHFMDFKHKYLDGIYFIADTMRTLYLDGIGKISPDYHKKMFVCHLGSYKAFSVMNKTTPHLFNICTCSRMIPLKRLEVLANALADWNKGKIRWTHIGDGPLMDELREKAQAIMSKNPLVKIVFKGFVPNKEVELYYASNPVDIFINLSTIEGLPISIMEAISYGIPIIATDVGGTKEIVHKEVGMLLPQNITTQLVLKSIEDFYLRPQNEQQKMRSSAYNYWKSNFDATNNIKNLFSLINNL